MKSFEVGSWSSLLSEHLLQAPPAAWREEGLLAVSPSASSSGTEDETKTGGEGW